jgi:uncharacterized membrane protein
MLCFDSQNKLKTFFESHHNPKKEKMTLPKEFFFSFFYSFFISFILYIILYIIIIIILYYKKRAREKKEKTLR